MTELAERRAARLHPRTRATVRSAGGRRAIFLLVIVAMLLTIGLGAMLSASSVVSIRANADQFELFTKQVLWVGLGLLALVVTTFVPYRVWQKYALPLFLLTLVGLVVTIVVVPGIQGAWQRWASSALVGASVLLPGGFLLGGLVVYGGDPGAGIALAPVGGVLFFAAVARISWALLRKTGSSGESEVEAEAV